MFSIVSNSGTFPEKFLFVFFFFLKFSLLNPLRSSIVIVKNTGPLMQVTVGLDELVADEASLRINWYGILSKDCEFAYNVILQCKYRSF